MLGNMRAVISCSSGSDCCATVTPVHLRICEAPSQLEDTRFVVWYRWKSERNPSDCEQLSGNLEGGAAEKDRGEYSSIDRAFYENIAARYGVVE
jgi:hypothetical protein